MTTVWASATDRPAASMMPVSAAMRYFFMLISAQKSDARGNASASFLRSSPVRLTRCFMQGRDLNVDARATCVGLRPPPNRLPARAVYAELAAVWEISHMNATVMDVAGWLSALLAGVLDYFSQPWAFYQIGIMIVALLAARPLGRVIEEKLEARARIFKAHAGLLQADHRLSAPDGMADIHHHPVVCASRHGVGHLAEPQQSHRHRPVAGDGLAGHRRADAHHPEPYACARRGARDLVLRGGSGARHSRSRSPTRWTGWRSRSDRSICRRFRR